MLLLLFSRLAVSDSLWPCGLQHARPPCPPLSPRICSNSCPSSRWCHPATSSSVAPFSSCLQSFPASGSFLISWLFASRGQSTRASASVLPMNIQDWFPLIFFIIQLKFYLLEAYRAVISSNNGSGMTVLYICFIHSFIHPTFWLLL